MGKESFIIYSSFYKPISLLSDKQLGRLFRAIFQYNLGEIVSVEDDIRMAFEFFKNQFEIDESKYRAKIDRDIENGRRGGNPNFKKGQSNPYYGRGEKEITQDNPPLSDITQDNPINDNDNVNDNNNIPPIIPPEGEKEGVGEEKNKRKRARPPIDTGFIEAPFREVMDKWLEYKRARGQTYKSETSIKICYKKLLEMSGGDPVKAEAIVENSIANNYAGIFPLKNTSLHDTDKPTASTSLTEEERERSFLEHINRKLGNIP